MAMKGYSTMIELNGRLHRQIDKHTPVLYISKRVLSSSYVCSRNPVPFQKLFLEEVQ